MPSRAGSPNKNKQALIALLQAKYPGYHPVMEMAAIANNDVECNVCGGTGRVTEFIGVEVALDKERFSEKPCKHCVDGKTIISIDMAFNANKEVAQYVTAKMKAVEHSGQIDSEVIRKHRVSFSRD